MDKSYKDIIYIKNSNNQKPKATIMFIHGFSSSNMIHYLFTQYNEFVEYDYVAINLPGHQFYDNNITDLKDYSINNYINYVKKFIIDSNINNIILIGHSMGGGISLFLTQLLKDRIKKIILVSAINNAIFNSKIGIKFINSLILNRKDSVKNIEYYQKNNKNFKKINKYILFEIDRLIQNKNKYLHLGMQLLNLSFYNNLNNIYINLDIPTLYLIGEYDKVIPYAPTIKYLKKINNPNIIIQKVSKSGHVCFVDNFDEYNNFVWSFINQQ